jgi:hypothetical protein
MLRLIMQNLAKLICRYLRPKMRSAWIGRDKRLAGPAFRQTCEKTAHSASYIAIFSVLYRDIGGTGGAIAIPIAKRWGWTCRLQLTDCVCQFMGMAPYYNTIEVV